MTESTGSRQAFEEDLTVPLPSDFRTLFDAEFSFTCRALLRLGVRTGDVEDVAQELFLTVHDALPAFDRGRPVRPWLSGFVVRYAANYRRLARLTETSTEGVEHGGTAGQDHEVRDLVAKLLDRLDFDRRAVVVLHDMEGFDAPEISEGLGVPLNTVYSRLRLARQELKSAARELGAIRGER